MFETAFYTVVALCAIAILIRITPAGTSIIGLVIVTVIFIAVLAAARHGPDGLARVIEALGAWFPR